MQTWRLKVEYLKKKNSGNTVIKRYAPIIFGKMLFSMIYATKEYIIDRFG